MLEILKKLSCNVQKLQVASLCGAIRLRYKQNCRSNFVDIKVGKCLVIRVIVVEKCLMYII